MTITLYRLEGCPFCEFVVDKLEELGLEYDSVWVEGPHSERDEVKAITGQRQVTAFTSLRFEWGPSTQTLSYSRSSSPRLSTTNSQNGQPSRR